MALKSYGERDTSRWMESIENMSDELRDGKLSILVLIMIE